MSLTTEQVAIVKQDIEAIIDRVAQEAKDNIMRALNSGAIELDSYSAPIIGQKIVAKAVMVDALNRSLAMSGKEKDVKNLVTCI